MFSARSSVAVTGMGAVCALGESCESLWDAVEEGRSGIGDIRRFATEGFSVRTGATVESASLPQPTGVDLTHTLCRRFAVQAGREALDQAAGGGPPLEGPRIALVFGTGIAALERCVHIIAEEVADDLRLFGPRLTVSTACSSSTSAIGFARDLLLMDAADVVLAGGADVLTPEVFAGFHALGVLSPGKCAPFSKPAGTTLGEGAAFLVLERTDRALTRGAIPIAELSGYGLSGDGWHETSPDPKGGGVERAIRAALSDAAVPAEAIGYVNAHGSGTEANDISEWNGMKRALGSHAESIPVSSSKGALGHAQGAAGALEATVTLLGMQRGAVPPTLNFTESRVHAPPDPVAEGTARSVHWDHALATNSAFGGSNAALIFSRRCGMRGAPLRKVQRVGVLGVGLVGPDGLTSQVPPDWNRETDSARRVGSFSFEELLPACDPRGLDPASRFLTAAAARALVDGSVSVRGTLRERTGLLVGQLRGSPASMVAFQRSIDLRGLLQLSPASFARIVLNAPAGFCSKLLSLRGPLSAVTTGAGSGLAAIILGAFLLSSRDDVDLMLVAGCDEHDPEETAVEATADEGAACLLLASERGALHSQTDSVRAWFSGWGLAGPDQLASASALAFRGSGVDPRTVATFSADVTRAGEGVGEVIAVAAAAQALAAGEIPYALVTSHRGNSVSAALLLQANGVVE